MSVLRSHLHRVDDRRSLGPVQDQELKQVSRAIRTQNQIADRIFCDLLDHQRVLDSVLDILILDAVTPARRRLSTRESYYETSRRARCYIERMLKASAQEEPTGTKARIVDATLETLRVEGFAGASARAIARRGGFNQALVFYHFGSVTNLLLAGLDETSRRRMAAYRAALDDADDPEELLDVALRVYREDLSSGHITVLAELIAGSLTVPGLRPEIVSRMDPWIDFAEEAIQKALQHSPLGGLPTRELAYVVVALYLGIEMLEHLETDQSRADSLFATARSLLPLFGPLLGGSQ